MDHYIVFDMSPLETGNDYIQIAVGLKADSNSAPEM